MTKLLHGNEKSRLTGGREPLFSQKELLVLAIPLLVEQLLEVTVGMADTMMVSRCGEAAISGVSLVDMINNLIIVLFAALATGGAVVVSQYLGAKERGNADKSAGQLLLLSGLSGVVIGVVCFVLARPMIRLFYGSIDTDVLDAGVKYLQIIALSYPFLALYNGGAALFRSIGNSKISMQISFLMNIINIVGNAVCIFGFKMGVDGVAWPSVVSRVVAAVLILRKCYREDAVLTVPKTLRLDGGMAKRILGIGIPLRHGADRSQRRGQQSGWHGRHPGQGHQSGHDHGSGALHRCRRPRADRLLHPQAAAVGLHYHGAFQRGNPAVPPAAGGHLRPFRRDHGAGHYAGHHPCGLRHHLLAAVLRAAQRPARGKRREIYHGGVHPQHGMLAVGLQLSAVRPHGLGRCGRVGGYGHRLDLPRDLLCAALPQRRMENKISGITIRRKA